VDWLVEANVSGKRAASIFRADASPKRRLLPTSPHGDLTQKNTITIVTAVKTLNLTSSENVCY
jgi:hypothetical protein